MINWPACLPHLLEDDSQFPADVIFKIVEDDKVHDIKAHKMLMAMASSVFRKMFTLDFKEKNSNEVKIEETTQVAFQVGVYITTNLSMLALGPI